jgi:hypothetical protein
MVRLGNRARVTAVVAALATAVVLGGCGGLSSSAGSEQPSPSAEGPSFQPTASDLRDLRTVLARRASAVLHHHERAFLATVDSRNASLVKEQRTLYQNLTRLGVSSFGYDVDTSSLLVPARLAGDDPTLRPAVIENVRIAGTTTRPVSNPVEDTFVRRDGHWLVGAESNATQDTSFEAAQDRPWSGVPIAVRRSGPLTVLIDASESERLGSLTTAVHDDISHDASLLGITPEYAVLVDATSNGLSHAMNSLSQEDAAAITRGLYHLPHGDDSRAQPAGTMIKMNPHTVDSVLARPDILRHELAHYLLRQYSGSSPRWLVEGVAAWVQYYPDDFAALQVPSDVYTRIMHADRQLPPEGLFYDYPDVNYLVGQAAVTWLVSNYGVARLLALMRAYRDEYQGVDIDPLTPRVLRQIYGVSTGEVVSGAFGLLTNLQH